MPLRRRRRPRVIGASGSDWQAFYDVLLARWKADLEFADLTPRWTVRAIELEFGIEPFIAEFQVSPDAYLKACRAAEYRVTESDVGGADSERESV